MSKMPVKAHVKGKRKAPPPPTKDPQTGAPVQVTSSSKPAKNNGRISSPSPSRIADQKAIKKKLAPSPPPTHLLNDPDASIKQNLNIDEDNLSSANNKFPVKNYENKPIFNLNELNGATRVNERKLIDTKMLTNGEPILLKYKHDFHFDVNNDIRNDINGIRNNGDVPITNGNAEEVWVCQYCTLENTFWKIVCAACDRLRPYGLPTKPAYNVAKPKNPNVSNILASPKSEVKLRRPKNNVEKNDLSKSNRNSLNIDPYTVSSVKPDTKDDDKTNKRKSIAISNENDFTMNTLEMEKQRLRAVIRSMNNQALAAKQPNQNETKINNIDAVSSERKDHTYEKVNDFDQGVIKNNLEKNINEKMDLKNKPAKTSTSIQTDDLGRASPMRVSPIRASPQRASPLRSSPFRVSPKLQLNLTNNLPPRSPKAGCSKNTKAEDQPRNTINGNLKKIFF